MADDTVTITLTREEAGAALYALRHAHAVSTDLLGRNPATTRSSYTPVINKLDQATFVATTEE